MTEDITINSVTNQEEAHNSFLKWLHYNPNNFSFWFQHIKNLAPLGIYIPKSLIVPVPDELINCFFFENKGDKERIGNWIRDNVFPKVKETFPSGKLFIKNGCFSNKFDFGRNCLINTPDAESLARQFSSIQYDSFCFDTCGNAEMVIREWIEPKDNLGTIYNGMPLRPELRVFYDFDKKEILYTANYWDWDYCNEGISRHSGDAETYKESYPRMLALLKEYCNIWVPVIDQALRRVPLRKQWSVDFILEEDRPILIDMALAQQSAYWDPDKIYR